MKSTSAGTGLFVITLLLAAASSPAAAQFGTSTAAQAEAEQGTCRRCEACEFGHENELAIPNDEDGNGDATHACWGQSCAYMQANNVHKNNSCGLGTIAQGSVMIGKSQLKSLRAARQLAALHPGQLVLTSSGRFLQELDCTGTNVIAQYEVRRTVGERVVAFAHAFRHQLSSRTRLALGSFRDFLTTA